jgi:hypothetical protein
MKKLVLVAAALAVLMPLVPQSAMAQRDRDRDGAGERFDERSFYDDRRGGGWSRIGEIVVKPRIEREFIRVNPREEAFSRVGVRAFDGDVEIMELNIRYGNNEVERVRVDKIVRAGTGLPPIDLPGRVRRLRDIEVVYRAFGAARIEVVGREGRGGPGPGAGPGPGRFQELGCAKVGFLEGKDVIRVGRKEGTFRAIKLNVRGNKLRLERLRVVYSNGQADDLVVRTVIPEGAETRPIDLSGRHRGIDYIELRYIPQITFGGRATVCVAGY